MGCGTAQVEGAASGLHWPSCAAHNEGGLMRWGEAEVFSSGQQRWQAVGMGAIKVSTNSNWTN